MHWFFIALLVSVISCTPSPSEEDIRIHEYGETYATMDCWWSSQEAMAPAIFWCTEDLEAELISGYVSLSIQHDLVGEEFFSICGRNVVLNTGHPLHDNTVVILTQNNYNCIDSYERELGNEFDWLWDDEDNILQLIWRPRDEVDKVLTLFIEEREDSPRADGRVYYKTGHFD